MRQQVNNLVAQFRRMPAAELAKLFADPERVSPEQLEARKRIEGERNLSLWRVMATIKEAGI